MLAKKNLFLASTFVLSSYAAHAYQPDYQKLFNGYDGCFMLYDASTHKMVSEYNPNNRCSQRIPTNSTFKMPLALMAFDAGIITDKTIFKWDGKTKSTLPGWNQDQTPASWQKYSVVWVSQQITPQLGLDKIKKYLAAFNYGNQDFSGDPGKNNGLTNAWLSSSLKISAQEQLNFLQAFSEGKLPVSKQALADTNKTLYQGKLDHGADYYAKTGSGWQNRSEGGNNDGKKRDGWYIGLVNNAGKQYLFVTNISDQKAPDPASKLMGGPIAKQISLQLLNGYFGA